MQYSAHYAQTTEHESLEKFIDRVTEFHTFYFVRRSTAFPGYLFECYEFVFGTFTHTNTHIFSNKNFKGISIEAYQN